MIDIANAAGRRSARKVDVSDAGEGGTAASLSPALSPLQAVADDRWRQLSDNAIEPNGYFLPEWERAVDAFARGRTASEVLTATTGGDFPRLIGLLPVIPAWRAYRLPLPVWVSADPYGTLATPLLDRACAEEAASQLLRHAQNAGARAILLRDMALDGPAMTAFTRALSWSGLQPYILQRHERACLDATRDADELLREALGPKKLKELRRQRNRLAELGEVIFTIASAPDEMGHALDTFLALEASGWKAKRGTALAQDAGDTAFIRRAVAESAARGNCEIVTLLAGETPVASAVVLRHLDRAFYFKLGVDERFSKFSPGVQLTLDLTRHMCADPAIAMVDSSAMPGHSMIDPIWRGRLAIGDVLLPLAPRDPAVSVIRLALAARSAAREPARRAIQFVRKIREARP